MRILQIITTAGKACGVANFGRNLEQALADFGVSIVTSNRLRHDGEADLVLPHHAWGLFEDDNELVRFCGELSIPVVVFAHSQEARDLAPAVDGFLTLSPGIVGQVDVPVLSLPHPAWVPSRLEDRTALKREFGLPDGPVIGSSGFLVAHRRFPEVLARLLPVATQEGWFVDLVTSRHYCGDGRLETELEAVRRRHPETFRFGTEFLSPARLNRRLQACDLLWCWTAVESTAYGSGSISDQYGSGTRILAADKEQHDHVLALPNVMRGSAALGDFVTQLVAEAARGVFPRHDPTLLSWRSCAAPMMEFLSQAARRGLRQRPRRGRAASSPPGPGP